MRKILYVIWPAGLDRPPACSIKAAKIHADDTPVPILMPGKGMTATARLWAYVVDDQAAGSAAPRLVWYRFTPDRSGTHPQRELETFSGLLQADGYARYDRLYGSGRVLEVACWAHFRRKIFGLTMRPIRRR